MSTLGSGPFVRRYLSQSAWCFFYCSYVPVDPARSPKKKQKARNSFAGDIPTKFSCLWNILSFFCFYWPPDTSPTIHPPLSVSYGFDMLFWLCRFFFLFSSAPSITIYRVAHVQTIPFIDLLAVWLQWHVEPDLLGKTLVVRTCCLTDRLFSLFCFSTALNNELRRRLWDGFFFFLLCATDRTSLLGIPLYLAIHALSYMHGSGIVDYLESSIIHRRWWKKGWRKSLGDIR